VVLKYEGHLFEGILPLALYIIQDTPRKQKEFEISHY
jgi:hypothetical protein